MAIKTDWTMGQVLTASQVSTYLTNSGLQYITSGTVGTSVTYKTITGAFSGNCDHYVISVSNVVTSSAAKLSLQFEIADGTPSTTNYTLLGTSMTWGSSTVTGITGTSWDVALCSDTSPTSSTFEVLQPYSSGGTTNRYFTSSHSDSTGSKFVTGRHTTAAVYTRFRLLVDAGTMTGGTIYVYGRRKQ